MKRKEALKEIKKKSEEGLTKKEIFDALSSKVKLKSDLIQYVALVPNYEDRIKYKTLNLILFSILIYVSISKLIVGALILGEVSIYALPFALLIPLLTVYFAVKVWNFYGNMYRILGMLGIAGVCKGIYATLSMPYYATEQLVFDTLFSILPGITITLLAFYIAKKVFPYYDFFGILNIDMLLTRA